MQRSYVLALGAIFLWSSLAFLGQKVSAIPAFLLVGITLFLGGLCSLPWWRQWRVSKKSLAIGVYGLFGYHFCLFMAFRLAPAVEVNLINYLWPLLIVLLSPMFFSHVALTKKHIIGSVLGFAGALLIASKGSVVVTEDNIFGYCLAAAAAFIWASYSLLSKKVSDITTPTIGLFCLLSGILSLACHFIFEPSYPLRLSEVPILILLGVGPMGAAFFLWDKSLKQGDPRIIGSLSYLTPLLSTLLLVVFAGGTFTMMTLMAMVLIISGAVIGSIS